VRIRARRGWNTPGYSLPAPRRRRPRRLPNSGLVSRPGWHAPGMSSSSITARDTPPDVNHSWRAPWLRPASTTDPVSRRTRCERHPEPTARSARRDDTDPPFVDTPTILPISNTFMGERPRGRFVEQEQLRSAIKARPMASICCSPPLTCSLFCPALGSARGSAQTRPRGSYAPAPCPSAGTRPP